MKLKPLAYLICLQLMTICSMAQAAVSPPDEPMSVWFDKPADSFLESCVLGNGRLGAMDLGGIEHERIVLNESSVWSGGPFNSNKPDAHKALPKIQKLLFSNDITAAT